MVWKGLLGRRPLQLKCDLLVSTVRLALYANITPDDSKPEIRPTVTSGPMPMFTKRADWGGTGDVRG